MCSRAQALLGLVYLISSLGDVDQLHQLRFPFCHIPGFLPFNYQTTLHHSNTGLVPHTDSGFKQYLVAQLRAWPDRRI